MEEQLSPPAELSLKDELPADFELGAWLGAHFEIGGHMSVMSATRTKKNGTAYTSVAPLVQYSDNNLKRMNQLQQMFGGSVTEAQGKKSYTWRVESNKAIAVAELIKPFAPSRSEIIAAFELLRDANDMEEKN